MGGDESPSVRCGLSLLACDGLLLWTLAYEGAQRGRDAGAPPEHNNNNNNNNNRSTPHQRMACGAWHGGACRVDVIWLDWDLEGRGV